MQAIRGRSEALSGRRVGTAQDADLTAPDVAEPSVALVIAQRIARENVVFAIDVAKNEIRLITHWVGYVVARNEGDRKDRGGVGGRRAGWG